MTEKNTASKGWFHRFRSLHELINVKLSHEAANSDRDAIVKFAPRFQELQAVLALHNSARLRLSCAKHFAGFGWNINEVVKDVDDHGNVDTASIQELVLDMQPEELSEGRHL